MTPPNITEAATPRTTAIVVGMHEDVSVDGPTIDNLNVFINHARTLERELIAITTATAPLEQQIERLKADQLNWYLAVLKTRLCRGDIDVSTPEKYVTAQLDASVEMLRVRDQLPQSNTQ